MANELGREMANGVLHLMFSTQDGRNAMDDGLWELLADALRSAADDSSVRVAILSGVGKAFCSGFNLRSFATTDMLRGFQGSSLCNMTHALMEFPKPLIAAVHGSAIGGGATLLLHCDLVVAASDTVFRLPFAGLGIVPELGSSYLLPRAAGASVASELMLLGDSFDAHYAQRAGLVNEVVPAGQEVERARQWAARLAALPPSSVQATKRLVKQPQRAALAEAVAAEGEALVTAMRSAEAREAVLAFLEKRPPDFSRFA